MKKSSSMRKILAESEGPLQDLVKQYAFIKTLNEALSDALEPALRPHCRVRNYQGGVMTIGVSSNAWATRLHFGKMDLVSTLRKTPVLTGLVTVRLLVD